MPFTSAAMDHAGGPLPPAAYRLELHSPDIVLIRSGDIARNLSHQVVEPPGHPAGQPLTAAHLGLACRTALPAASPRRLHPRPGAMRLHGTGSLAPPRYARNLSRSHRA